MQKIAILGGSGFIGSHACRYFSKTYDVYVIDKTAPHENFSGYLNINICDKPALYSALGELNPTYVLHLASKSTVSACHEEPEEAYFDNVMGTLHVLTACQKLLQRKNSAFQKLLVHTSDKVYGEHPEEDLPYRENYPHYRADVYSTSKAAQDMVTLCWASQYHLPFSTVRSGNIYGPGDCNFSRLIPQTINRLLEGKKARIYCGNEQARRDFVYIDDLLRGYEYIFLRGKDGEAYNIGGSGPITVAEVVEIIKQMLGKEHEETEIVQRDLPEFKAQYLDTTKLQNLGWHSQTSLPEGIRSSILFYQEMLAKL